MVRRVSRLIPSVPILPEQGESGHPASTGAHGEEAVIHRGEERSTAESKRGTRESRAG